MLSCPARSRLLCALLVLMPVGMGTPALADGGNGDSIQVRGDNKGGSVDTTVAHPGTAASNDGPIGPGTATPVDAGSGSGGTCTYDHPDSDQLFQETRDGVDGTYYFVNCSDGSRSQQWFPNTVNPPSAGARLPTATPGELAQQAVGRLPLPAPAVRHNPDSADGRPQTVVSVDTWLWVAPGSYRTLTQTVSAGPVWATVTAEPVSTRWTTGSPDAANVRCAGPGVAYDPGRSPDAQSTYCSTVYNRSSADQPRTGPGDNDRFFIGSATTTWRVSWVGSGGAQGQLPDLERTSSFRLAVAELQAVNY